MRPWRDGPARCRQRFRSRAVPCRTALYSARPGAPAEARRRISPRFHSPLDGLAGVRRPDRNHSKFGTATRVENHLKTALYQPASPRRIGTCCSRRRLARSYPIMERVMHLASQSLLLVLAFGPALAAPAGADDFYKGKTITLVVANAAGGGYDLYARLLARHMGRHIPGEPGLVVKYQPGAGGMLMANAIYGTAPRHGLTIGLMARANPLQPV